MSLFSVYKHSAPNGKVYIGITSQIPARRWRNGNGYYQNEHFTRAIKKYGWENFSHEVLYSGLNKSEACYIEKELIKQYKSNDDRYGYNNSTGGENPAEGKRHTQETKEKMSVSHKGKKNTPEHNLNISKAKKGKPNGLKGKTGGECHKAGVVQMIDMTTGEVIREFFGYDEMERKTGFKRSPVRMCADGKRRKSYGYKWNYIPRGKVDVFIR